MARTTACICAGMHVHEMLAAALCTACGSALSAGRVSETRKSGRTFQRSVRRNSVATKGAGGSQSSAPKRRCSRGQYIHGNCAKTHVMMKAATMVPIAPPIKPSSVFFGESCISGVRPHVMPARTRRRPLRCAQNAATRTPAAAGSKDTHHTRTVAAHRQGRP